jgi:hypothetical protein
MRPLLDHDALCVYEGRGIILFILLTSRKEDKAFGDDRAKTFCNVIDSSKKILDTGKM